MNDDEIERIININTRLLLIMGYTISTLLEIKDYIPKEKEKKINWIIHSVENIVYFDEPLPPIPE